MSLKDAKEAFVTGHKGTTVSEILLVCISAPIGIFLYHEIRNLYICMPITLHNHQNGVNTKNRLSGRTRRAVLTLWKCVVLEAITILFPMAICQTKLLHPYGVMLLAFEAHLAIALHIRRKLRIPTLQASINKRINITKEAGIVIDDQNKDTTTTTTREKLDFLTFYRSTVSYLTFVAILAVDFPIFPRSFAKTEISGYGLMDLGAGSFCVSGGFVSWFARRKSREEKKSNKSSDTDTTEKLNTNSPRLLRVIIRCLPLIAMGFIRLLTTKGLEYQEHVSEYGVHWNFFFTLSLVGVLSTFLRANLRIENSLWWVAFAWTYQMLLSENGANMQQYIEEAPRRCSLEGSLLCHFFAANREGILGCVGYLILHLASEDIAHLCLWQNRLTSGIEKSGPNHRGWLLACIAALFWMLHWFLVSVLAIPVSRRSTNLSFVVWTIAHNMTILFATWMAFRFGCPDNDQMGNSYEKNPPIFLAVNRHGLIVFILSNLMTGAVNLSIDTLNVSDFTAITVIFLYLCAIGAIGLLLDYYTKSKEKMR